MGDYEGSDGGPLPANRKACDARSQWSGITCGRKPGHRGLHTCFRIYWSDADIPEVDRLTALEAENERLRGGARVAWGQARDAWAATAQLHEALEEIAAYGAVENCPCVVCRLVNRAHRALTPDTKEDP